jgi:hypothetical protein
MILSRTSMADAFPINAAESVTSLHHKLHRALMPYYSPPLDDHQSTFLSTLHVIQRPEVCFLDPDTLHLWCVYPPFYFPYLSMLIHCIGWTSSNSEVEFVGILVSACIIPAKSTTLWCIGALSGPILSIDIRPSTLC